MTKIKPGLKVNLIFCAALLNLSLTFQNLTPQNILDVSFSPEFEKFDKKELIAASGLQGIYSPSQNPVYAEKIENYFIQRGYLFAKINQIVSIYDSSLAGVNIFIDGSAGKIVLFGDLVVNSDSITTDNFLNIMNTKKFDIYNEKIIENDVNEMLSLAADSGYIFAEAHIENIEMIHEENNILAQIKIDFKEGELIRIEEIDIAGNSYTRSHVIQRELPLRTGDIYSKSEIEKIPKELLKLGLFKNVTAAQILRSENGKYVLSIKVEEGNATTFDGVVGYIPDKSINSGGFFTGLLDIQFNNLFGTARKFYIHWEKPGQNSENFNFRYTEPWLLNYPIDLSAGFERTLRDSTYIEWKGDVEAKWRLTKNLSLVSSYEKQVVLPDSTANINLRLVRYEQYNIKAGIEYDSRDYPLNPRSGFFVENSYTLGLKNNFGPSYLLLEDKVKSSEQVEILKVAVQWYYEMFRNQVIAIRLNANQVTGNRLQKTDYFWFGGARTLRGYRENQFSGDFVSWLKLEYRFLLSRDARIFVFNDWGAYHFKDSFGETDEVLTGYGIGLRLDTALGIMAIDFGMGKNDEFGDAKIHFGIINRF